MKHNNQHTIKKSYTKPIIEEVMIDREISIAMGSTPPEDPDPKDPIDPNPPGTDGVSSGPNYPTKYRSESPFGGNSPNYK